MRVDTNEQTGGQAEDNAQRLLPKGRERAVGGTPQTVARVRAVQALLSDLAQICGESLVRGCCGQGCCHPELEPSSGATADADGRRGA